jgi:hypothetical protein
MSKLRKRKMPKNKSNITIPFWTFKNDVRVSSDCLNTQVWREIFCLLLLEKVLAVPMQDGIENVKSFIMSVHVMEHSRQIAQEYECD